MTAGPNWLVPAHRIGDGKALLEATLAQDLEGVMAKRLGTTYRPGARSRDWRKVKNRRQAEVVIGGYTAGSGNRSSSFGALLVGRWADGALAFAGGVGTGFTQKLLDELTARLGDLRTDECPFDPPPPRVPARRHVGPLRAHRRWSRWPSSPTTASSARPASSAS